MLQNCSKKANAVETDSRRRKEELIAEAEWPKTDVDEFHSKLTGKTLFKQLKQKT